jgi:enamine deaminase RidA (YjgF/YER057c/UK114 family)
LSDIDELLETAEQNEIEKQNDSYTYLDNYLRLEDYVSDYPIITIASKNIYDLTNEISIVGESYSQYMEFETNRFQDGIDLTEMNFHISYVKDGNGGEDAPVNVRYNTNNIILGWIITNNITASSGTLQIAIWAQGTKYDNDYVWKTKPKTYTIQEGLKIADGIVEPDENWYLQFTKLIDEKVNYVSGQAGIVSQANEATANANTAAERAETAAQACEGIVDGMNTLIDTETGSTGILSLEDGLLVVREA